MDDFDKIELTDEIKVKLREKQSEIARIMEALDGLEKTKDWKVLKELLFAPSLEAIERQMRNEVLAPKIDIEKLYRLQGEWAWARQYTDLPSFIKTLKIQLEGIKNKLK